MLASARIGDGKILARSVNINIEKYRYILYWHHIPVESTVANSVAAAAQFGGGLPLGPLRDNNEEFYR